MRKIFSIVFFSFILFIAFGTKGQSIANEIDAFKKVDSVSYPYGDQQPIVFVGSSSFRKWVTLQEDFRNYPVLNRGFGGSTLADVIRYAPDIIIKYKPKQVIIYGGENDLASSDSITAKIVFKRFKELFLILRRDLPFISIAFVSIKPSPSRQKIQLKVIEANKLIRKFLKTKNKTAYIDIYYAMLNTNGTMRKELFLADELHMNEKGYAIWQEKIQPYLIK